MYTVSSFGNFIDYVDNAAWITGCLGVLIIVFYSIFGKRDKEYAHHLRNFWTRWIYFWVGLMIFGYGNATLISNLCAHGGNLGCNWGS